MSNDLSQRQAKRTSSWRVLRTGAISVVLISASIGMTATLARWSPPARSIQWVMMFNWGAVFCAIMIAWYFYARQMLLQTEARFVPRMRSGLSSVVGLAFIALFGAAGFKGCQWADDSIYAHLLEFKKGAIVGKYESADGPYRGIVQFRKDGQMRIDHDDIAIGVSGKYRFVDESTIGLEYDEYYGGWSSPAMKYWTVERLPDGLILTSQHGARTILKYTPAIRTVYVWDSYEKALAGALAPLKEIKAILSGVADVTSAQGAVKMLEGPIVDLSLQMTRVERLDTPTDAQLAESRQLIEEFYNEVELISRFEEKLTDDATIGPILKKSFRQMRHSLW